MTYADASYSTNADLRAGVVAAFVDAGFVPSTNANPFTATIDYTVLKSPAAANAAGVDWFVCIWMDTVNHRVAVMPFEEFTDLATPQYRKFCPAVNGVPAGDGYATQVLQTLGAFAGSPSCIVLERGTGTCRLVSRVTPDAAVFACKGSAATYMGGYVGTVDWATWNTERPVLVCAANLSTAAWSAGYPPLAAASLPTGSSSETRCSMARETLPGITAITNFTARVQSLGTLLAANTNVQDAQGLRDAFDITKLWTWDALVYQMPVTSALALIQPRIKMIGKLRDIKFVSGVQPEIGDLLTIDGSAHRCIASSNSVSHTRAVYVLAT